MYPSRLFKIPLLLLDALCMRVSATPPNPTGASGRISIPDWREKFLRSLSWPCVVLRAISWSSEFLEVIVIIASCNPNGPISRVLLLALTPADSCVARIRISPIFLVGSILNLAGTYLRVHCYRTLGRLFTFELRIQDGHELITDGPYAYVRHPSYSALILTIVGAFFAHVSGSWVVHCGLLRTPLGWILASFWVIVALAVIASLLLRISREDEMLKRQFEGQWMRWATEVPNSLIPFVY